MSAIKNARDEQRDAQRAKRAARKQGSSNRKVEWRGYVNYSLTNTEKAAFTTYSDDVERVWDDLAGALERGYKQSAYWDARTGAFVGALYCTDGDSPNAGYTITMRGSSLWVALARVVFVCVRVLEYEWPLDAGNHYTDDMW